MRRNPRPHVVENLMSGTPRSLVWDLPRLQHEEEALDLLM